MGCGGSNLPNNADAEFLKRLKLFAGLGSVEIEAVVKSSKIVEFLQGAVIVQQGALAEFCFVIKTGTATTVKDGKQIELKSGSVIGDKGLAHNQPEDATITVTKDVQAIRIKPEDFSNLNLAARISQLSQASPAKAQGGPRFAAAGGGKRRSDIEEPSPKTEEEVALILKALEDNVGLHQIAILDDEKRKDICDIMWKQNVEFGKEIIAVADPEMNTYFYIVQSGNFSRQRFLEKMEDEEPEFMCLRSSAYGSGGGSTWVADGDAVTFTAGGSFGEEALLGILHPSDASVTAESDGVLWVFARHQFKDILLKQRDNETRAFFNHIERCDCFRTMLKDEEMQRLASVMQVMTYSKGKIIFEEWKESNWFFVLIRGSLCVAKEGHKESHVRFFGERAHCFGVQCLEIDGFPQEATVSVTSESAKILWVDKESFELVVGCFNDFRKRGRDGTAMCKRMSCVEMAAGIGSVDILETNRASGVMEHGMILYQDLKQLGQLGCGGFGSVDLVMHKPSAETYALKTLSKGFLVKTDSIDSVLAEKDTLLMCNSPYVIRLYETFNRGEYLYMLLEVCLGGEILAIYNTKSFWGSFAHARYYVAGTIMALEHLHRRKIIHRDIKPENLLLNDYGNVKLTDLGLSKVVPNKTYTSCGTPPYMAPEMIGNTGHTTAVDWWALGILLFELLAGFPPFGGSTPMDVYAKINKGMNSLPKFPFSIRTDAEDLIKALCKHRPDLRLAMKQGGGKNVRKHGWYLDFAWDEFVTFGMKAPHDPYIKSRRSTKNFEAAFKGETPHEPYEDPGTGWDAEFATSQ